jgi:hypothetical protein
LKTRINVLYAVSAVPADVIECPQCQFPQNGDEASQRWFLGQLRHEKVEEEKAAFRVGHAFNLLLGLPVFLLLVALYIWKNIDNILVAEVVGLIGLVFLSIWIFGRRNPYRAFAISLGLYALLTIPLFIYRPGLILGTRGILIAPYIYLFIGLQSFKYWESLDKHLEEKTTG